MSNVRNSSTLQTLQQTQRIHRPQTDTESETHAVGMRQVNTEQQTSTAHKRSAQRCVCSIDRQTAQLSRTRAAYSRAGTSALCNELQHRTCLTVTTATVCHSNNIDVAGLCLNDRGGLRCWLLCSMGLIWLMLQRPQRLARNELSSLTLLTLKQEAHAGL